MAETGPRELDRHDWTLVKYGAEFHQLPELAPQLAALLWSAEDMLKRESLEGLSPRALAREAVFLMLRRRITSET